MTPIFVAPLNEIPSYGDLFRLARLSGFDVRSGKIERKTGECYITIFHCGAELYGSGGKTVLWYLERVFPWGKDDSFVRHIEDIRTERGIDEVWVSDMSLRGLLKSARFVPVGSHAGLSPLAPEKSNYEYDIADMCYRNPRRGFIGSLGCRIAPPCYPPQRDAVLSSTKFMLNVHQDGDLYMEPLRFAVACSAGLPIITEKCWDVLPYKGAAIIETEYPNIVPAVQRLLRTDYSPHKQAAMEMRNMILEKFNFKDCIMRALGE